MDQKLTKGSLFTVVISVQYSVSGESTVNVSASCIREGYRVLGVVGLSGLTANCFARQYYISEGEVNISIYNKATSTQSGTVNVRVLYRAS